MSRGRPTIAGELQTHLADRAGVLVGVSGGVDSTALLHGCVALSRERRLVVEVAHLDHGLRPESAEDARRVADFATSLGLSVHVARAPERPAGTNSEAWGRGERYSFFRRVLAERSLECVLTAHTANDVAETLLMRLISNKEPRTIQRWDPVRRVLRPFLSIERWQTEEHVRVHELPYVVDATNGDLRLLRNRVRHRLLPLIHDEFTPRGAEILALRALALGEDLEWLDGEAVERARVLEAHPFGTRAWLGVAVKLLQGSPEALRWRIAAASVSGKLGFTLGRDHARRLAEFLLGGAAGIELPDGWRMRRRAGGIELLRGTTGGAGERPGEVSGLPDPF